MHRHVDAGDLEHVQRVAGGVVDRRVAAHRGDAEQLGVLGGDEDRDRVVETWITVEDDRRTSHRRLHTTPTASAAACSSITSTRRAMSEGSLVCRAPPVAPASRRAYTPSTMHACFHQENT